MAPHWWPLWTYNEDRDEWKKAVPAERQGSEVKRGRLKPKDRNHLVGWGGKGQGHSYSWEEVRSLPGL